MEYWDSINTTTDIDMQWMPKNLLKPISVDFIRNSLEIMSGIKVSELTIPLVDVWT
jgi:hypothetical protein